MPQSMRPYGLVLLLLAGCSSSTLSAVSPTSITCDHTLSGLPATLDQEGDTYCLGGDIAGASGEITIAADNVTLYGGGAIEIQSDITVECKTWNSTCTDGYLGAVLQDVRTSGGIVFWRGGNHQVLGVCDALEECTCKGSSIALYGSSGNLVSGCRFETDQSRQVDVTNELGGVPTDNTFEKSLFLGNSPDVARFIHLAYDQGTIFQDNLVRMTHVLSNGDSSGMIPMYGSNGNVIRRNTLSMEWVTPAYAAGGGSFQSMITLRDKTRNLTFEDNRVYGNGGIVIFHAGSIGPPEEGNVFRHNLIYQLPVIDDEGTEITAPAFWVHTDPAPFDVIGNTIITRGTPFWEDVEGNLLASDNLLYQIDNPSSCTVDGNHNYNYSESACPAATKPLFVDPLVDRSANPPLLGDFDQLADSPALGFGVPNHDDSNSGSTSGCAASGGPSTSWLLLGFLAVFRLLRRRSAA